MDRKLESVAHELNNPLTYNLANLSFARRTVADLAERVRRLEGGGALAQTFADLADALREASEGGERVKQLVQELKSLARAQPDRPDPRVPQPPPVPTPPRRARVLVIDDEPSVGRSVARALGGTYDVTVAVSAEEALPLVMQGAADDPAFDVVISDLMMPGMSGMELYERIEQAAPARAASFLFFTGGVCGERARAFVQRMAGRVIDKPFDVDRLAELVGEWVRARAEAT